MKMSVRIPSLFVGEPKFMKFSEYFHNSLKMHFQGPLKIAENQHLLAYLGSCQMQI